MLTLESQERIKSANPRLLRKEGFLPAVVYGSVPETLSISVPAVEFLRVWREAGESSVVSLALSKGNKKVLIYDVQKDPVKEYPIHVDFYAIDEKKEVEVDVPIEFVGVSGAIKELGGTLVKVMHEMKIKGLPSALPHAIEVDISSLAELDSQITVADIKLPAGITAVMNPEEIVVLASTAKEEQEEEPQQDISSIEVEKKGKKEEENAEGEEKK